MDAAETIEKTLCYLAIIGLRSDQVHVLVNNTTDNTADLASATGLAEVHEQEDIFDRHAELTARLENWGVTRDRLSGKGAAMYSAMLMLSERQMQNNDPIVFLDVDIDNLFKADPVRRLLMGWHAFGGGTNDDVKMVKLSGMDRLDHWVHPFLAAHPLYADLAALRWPLCGQVVLPWHFLSNARFATGYGIEMAMLMSLKDHYSVEDRLAEVQTNVGLIDDYVRYPQTLDRRFRMLWQIQKLLMVCVSNDLGYLNTHEIKDHNLGQNSARYWSITDDGSQDPNQPVDLPVDAILPSLFELKR